MSLDQTQKRKNRNTINPVKIFLTLFLVIVSIGALLVPRAYAPHAPSANNIAPSAQPFPWDDNQEDSCYGNGQFWVFNNNGSGTTPWHYWVGPNGKSWTVFNLTLPPGVMNIQASFHCIGNTVYYVYGQSSTFNYRYGSLNAGGTITWTIPETSVATTGGSAQGESITVDSSNNIWVSVGTSAGVEVYEHTTTWSQSDLISGMAVSQLFALTSGKVANVYGPSGFPQQVSIKVFSTSWSSPQSTGSYSLPHGSGIAIGDTVYETQSNLNQCDFLTSNNGAAWSVTSGVLARGEGQVFCTIQKDTGTDLVLFSTSYTTGNVHYTISNDLGAHWGAQNTIVTDSEPLYLATGDFSDGTTFFAAWESLGTTPYELRIGLVPIA